MSAYVVSTEHIDALLRAGMVSRDGLRWHAPEPREESDYERGEPWGTTATENALRVMMIGRLPGYDDAPWSI
jgi:hypothetical protein